MDQANHQQLHDHSYCHLPSYQEILLAPPPPAYTHLPSKGIECSRAHYNTDEEQDVGYHEKHQTDVKNISNSTTTGFLKIILYTSIMFLCIFVFEKYYQSLYLRN